MPKLESPFIRLQIKNKYVVTPKIDPDYTWVFEDDSVRAIEKLDGTNVSIVVQGGRITSVWNRENPVDILSISPVMDALRNSYEKGLCRFIDGQYFGEAIGEKINGNPHEIKGNVWLPLNWMWDNLSYKTWGQYPKDFDSISSWFKAGLLSLYGMREHHGDKTKYCEGVVFTHPDGRMAKLRRDMFDWYQDEKKHKWLEKQEVINKPVKSKK